MFDFYINPSTGDIDFSAGTVTLVSETKKRVRQELEITLRTFIGEWFNNLQFGGINREYIGRIGVSKIEVDAFYRRVILSNPEVIEILDFSSSLDPISRHYELYFTVRTAEGNIQIMANSASNEQTYTLPDSNIYLPPTTPSIKSMATFIYGSSSMSVIFGKDSNPIVSEPILGTSALSATPLKLWNAVALSGSSSVVAGQMIKALSTNITGMSTIASAVGTLMSTNITNNVSSISAAIAKDMNGNISSTSLLNAAFRKAIAADVTGVSNISALMARSGFTDVSGTSSITSTMTKLMSANLSGTSTLAAGYSVQMAANITGSSTFTSNIGKALHASLTGNSSAIVNMNKRLSASQNNAGTISAKIVKKLSANIAPTSSPVYAKPNYKLSGSLTGSSGVIATLKKIKKASANISGTSNITSNLSKKKNISSSITGTSNLTATMTKLFLAAGDTMTAYDIAVINSNPLNYWKLHEDYSVSVPSPPKITDMLLGDSGSLYSPSISTVNFTGEALLNYPSSRSVNLNSSSAVANLKYRLVPSGSLSQNLTLNFWIKTASSGVTANSLLAAKTTTGNPYWAVTLQNTGSIFFSLNDYNLTTYTVWLTSTGIITTNSKYFVSIVFDNSQSLANKVSIYINGVPVTVTQGYSNSTSDLISNSSTLSDLILVPYGSQAHKIESVSLHGGILTPAQISDLYTIGNN